MATPDPSDKVKDKEYSNWLKVNLALYYMKSGLHTFIQSEIDCLHQSLVQKIYAGQKVQPCTTCNASCARRNKHTGVWKFQTLCKVSCDVWFDELLALHNNPKSDKIYWANSDVSLWPSNPWESAKVFLPRGQLSTNTGPAESDAQALMVLLANCKHFHPKLSQQGQTLTHSISTIRNKVIHDGAMKLSDADKTIFIQQIIQLLEDPVHLQSLDDCKAAVSNIHKIENDSLDVFFNVDTEMKALKAAVNELRLEHGTQEKVLNNIDSLKEEYKHLIEQLTDRFENELKLHGTRMDTIQRDIHLVKEETDTALKQQEEKHQKLYAAVTKHEARLVAVEENAQAIGRKLEELKTNVLTQRGNNSHRIRTAGGEGISNCDKSEASAMKKRQESDGLRQLKNETEDILDTFRMKGFIQTTQTVEAKTLLQAKRSIVISGNPGEGKTSMAFHLIDNDNYRNQCVVVKSPKDWKKVDTNWVKIVVLEDIFGRCDLKPERLNEWVNDYLQTIQDHVDVGKLQVIITIRKDILSKADSKLKSFRLFSSEMSLALSSEKLEHSDKMSILSKELQRKNKDMNVDEKEQCIVKFSGMIGFPQCCFLFAQHEHLFSQGSDFFKSPEKFLVDIIRNLEPKSFLPLAFLFCVVEIKEEYLSPSQIKKSKTYLPLLEDLAKYLCISFNESTVISLRDSYDHYSGLYVKKVHLYKHHSGGEDRKLCIQFFHATVCEAVGKVLGDKCPEMVVKHGDSEYLYQRTYTAEAKDDGSQNVFIHESVYGLLVDRMLHDVIEKGIVESVVKHSVLKQNLFLMKLKDELHKGNRIRDFLMAESIHLFHNLSEGMCTTFLQYVLQSDEDKVKLVYYHFIEFLACTHNKNSSDCWQCKEKQTLLELALYYHHFQIANKLITMNACCTHVSLCNVARHGDLNRVQTIMEYLKRSQLFSPECVEAKKALCQAYLSRIQDVTEILLQEGITLDSMHVVHAVQHGDINVLMKVVEHLKYHSKWHPHWDKESTFFQFFHPHNYSEKFLENDIASGPFSIALYITYCNGKFKMADYLLKNEAKVSLKMLAAVIKHSSNEAVARVIQHLKVNHIWDPHSDAASKVLATAYEAQKYDVCDLLEQEGVSLVMKHFPHVIFSSLDYVKTIVKRLKDTNIWNPKCKHASKSLAIAYSERKYDVCDLLIQEGASLTMKNLPRVAWRFDISFEAVKKAVHHLKDTNNWNPKCEDASKALEEAYGQHEYDVCDLLIHEGASLTMKNLPCVVWGLEITLEAVKKAVQHLKETSNWDPKCEDASKALADACRRRKYDVYDLLIQEGASLTMKNLPLVVVGRKISLEDLKKSVQHLKDTNNWDPKCKDASISLAIAYGHQKYDVCDLLIQEGASLTMKDFPLVVSGFGISLGSVMEAVQHLKETNNWDPKCDDASKALEEAYGEQKYALCDLLIQEGVSLTMKNIPYLVGRYKISLEHVTKAVQHLKETNSWDPRCEDASKVLAKAYKQQKYDVCDMLIQSGASLTMKNLQLVVGGLKILEAVKKAVQHLKDTNNWDPRCKDASKALSKAFRQQKHDVCYLLIQEGASLTMKNLPHVVGGFDISLTAVKKAVQHLKDTDNWDPKCEDASEALAVAYGQHEYDVYDLLIQEGASLTMKNVPCVVERFNISLDDVKKAVQHLKETSNWDPKCEDASKALINAYRRQKYDVYDLLIQEGASLTMKNLPLVVVERKISLEDLKKSVQHLKDTSNWDPKYEDASIS